MNNFEKKFSYRSASLVQPTRPTNRQIPSKNHENRLQTGVDQTFSARPAQPAHEFHGTVLGR